MFLTLGESVGTLECKWDNIRIFGHQVGVEVYALLVERFEPAVTIPSGFGTYVDLSTRHKRLSSVCLLMVRRRYPRY